MLVWYCDSGVVVVWLWCGCGVNGMVIQYTHLSRKTNPSSYIHKGA